MKYNHDKFVKSWSLLQSEAEQMDALKNYMFNLPDSEFDNFLMWRFEEAMETMTAQLENDSLTTEQRNNFLQLLERLLTKADLLNSPTRRAA
jgi:uncharacterized tellurite resistance protein B-like protein